MRRILIVYNPNSSQHDKVKGEVIEKLRGMPGYMVGRYEIETIGFKNNVKKIAQILEENDLVVVAGGDATASMVVNAILKSNKNVMLAVLPYGNFSDLAKTLGVDAEILKSNLLAKGSAIKGSRKVKSGLTARRFYPLEVRVDEEAWRYAACYVTMGMTAEATVIFDEPKNREKLQRAKGRKTGSYFTLADWYFKNRHRKKFIPSFEFNGEKIKTGTSDYFAVNGKRAAGVMKSAGTYENPQKFNSACVKLTSFNRLMKFMARSMFNKMPLSETNGDTIKLLEDGEVTIQIEGEAQTFKNVKKIEIRKSEKYLSVITK